MNENNSSIFRQASTTKELANCPVVSKLPNGLRLKLKGSGEGKVTTYDSEAIPRNNGRILTADRSYGRSYGSNDENVQEEGIYLLKEGEVDRYGQRRLFPRQQEIIAIESTVCLTISWRKGKTIWEKGGCLVVVLQ